MDISKVRYYCRRISQAPTKVILRKLWAIFFLRACNVLYFAKRYKILPEPPTTDRCKANILAIGKVLKLGLINHYKADGAGAGSAKDRAECFLESGVFQILGYGNVVVGLQTPWHRDAIHSFTWPSSYFGRLDFVAIDNYCDVKVPWELSRFQYLLWLSEGYLLDSENKQQYLLFFVEIVRDWLNQNPVGYGVNWVCPMEVAIRSSNLVLAFAVFSDDLDEQFKQEVIASLADHATFIRRFPEFSDVPGNHYLSNLMGLALLDAFFYGVDSSQAKIAFKAFYEEADSQFEPDGCQLERAPVYHRLCVDMLALVMSVERIAGPVSTEALSVFERAMSYCEGVGSSEYLLPVMGDCDSGHILWFGENARDFEGLVFFAGAIGGTPVVSSRLDSNTKWLYALSGAFTAVSVEACPRSGNCNSDKSGFLTIRNKSLCVVKRVGGQGLKGRASHDHDDAQSIWVFLEGKDFIVEMGCHSYTLDRHVRASYIGSRAHNLIQPCSKDRYEGGIGSIVKTAVGADTCVEWSTDNQSDSLQTARSVLTPKQSDYSGVVFSKRDVSISKHDSNWLFVTDEWQSAVKQAMELRWHFPAEYTVVLDANMTVNFIEKASSKLMATLNFDVSSVFDVEVFEYCYSPLYGESIMAYGVRLVIAPVERGLIKSRFSFDQGVMQ